MDTEVCEMPDMKVSVRQAFGIDRDLEVPAKSTDIEQVAARLNWPCVRVNLDSHISRFDLVGKDSIVINDGKAGHRIPRRYSALGPAAQYRAGDRRIGFCVPRPPSSTNATNGNGRWWLNSISAASMPNWRSPR
jgi:hypothetical protein